jgi:hypothetical protein
MIAYWKSRRVFPIRVDRHSRGVDGLETADTARSMVMACYLMLQDFLLSGASRNAPNRWQNENPRVQTSLQSVDKLPDSGLRQGAHCKTRKVVRRSADAEMQNW